jgi:putative photosynthetic complex assembly protein 2
MTELALAAGFAVLAWWFTTGVILFLDRLPRRTFRLSMAGATAILAAAACALRSSANDATACGAYGAFICAVLIWGWLEMSFLMGFITGPRKNPCPDKCGGWRHFLHAAQAIIYNELATLLAAALVLAATWQSPNKVGLWTFLVLWTMRLSAKLNLFFGVPNTGENLLPPHLHYLKSFFRRRAMNPLFPVSISVSTAVAAILIRKCLVAPAGFQSDGLTLVASLLALAVLEHWFMILPWRTEKLWNWGLKTHPVPRRDVPAGLAPAPAPARAQARPSASG